MSREQSCAASGRPAAAEPLQKVAHEAAPSLGQRAGRAASRAADHTALLFATQVSLPKPLGIAFEEVEPGKGVVVDYLVEGSNAEQCGRIQPGDILIAVTAYKVPPMTSRLPCLSVTLSGCVSTDPASTRTHVILPPCAPIDRPQPAAPVASVPALQAPSAMSRFERKLIPCRCARAQARG